MNTIRQTTLLHDEPLPPKPRTDTVMDQWVQDCKGRIFTEWLKPRARPIASDAVVLCSVKLDQSGKVLAIRLISSTGTPAVSKLATDTIIAAGPFMPLPAEIKTRIFNVQFYDFPIKCYLAFTEAR